MISPDTLRRLIEVADVRRAPYAVAAACASLLEHDPRDAHAMGHYVRALAALELGTAARRALAAIPTEARPSAEVLAPIERLPAGVIPWSSRKRRFQANLRALEARGFSTPAILAAWEDPALNNAQRYELHQAADGNFFVADTGAPTEGGAVPPIWKSWLGGGAGATAGGGRGGLQDFKNAAAAITRETFQNEIHGPLAFDGMGYGWHLSHVLQVSERFYYSFSPPLYVVEPDLSALCMVLHMHDLQAAIADPRLRLFIGEGAAGQYARSLLEHADWSPPMIVQCRPLRPRTPLDMQGPTEAVIAARDENRRQTLERVSAYYAQFSPSDWRRRFAQAAAGGPPLRALGITTRYSTVIRYSMEELQAAARSAVGGGVNLHMEICMEPDDQSLEKDYVGMIDRFKPDLLVSISRLRHENPDLPRNIPALCWDQDNLPCMRESAVLADLKGLTFVAGHGAVFGATQLHWPEEACIFCHPAGMTHRYHPAAPSPEEAQRFGSDVSYVSHASGLPEHLRDSFRLKWQGGPPEYLALFDRSVECVFEHRRQHPSPDDPDLGALIRSAAGQARVPLTPFFEQTLLIDLRLLLDRMFRHEALGWVARWCESRGKSLRLWGNGWETHPTLGRWAAGAALPGDQAQAVFRATRINLQIIGTGILHSRLLDGWAAGGFFLIRDILRGQEDARMRTEYRIGQLTALEGITTIAQLESRGGDELRALWSKLAPTYATQNRQSVFPEFRVWRHLVPPQVLIPSLDRLTFNNAAEFEKLADDYCSHDELRLRTLDGIRQVLVDHLSYNARWRDFIGHMTAHVGYGHAPPPAPAK